MKSSRRNVVSSIGIVAVATVSGCTAPGQLRDNGTGAQPTENNREGRFKARLSGPETEELLFDKTDISSVGEVQERRGSFILPITLTEDTTVSISETFRTAGVRDNTDAFEIVLVSDGEEINRFGIAPALAESITAGEWDSEFVLTFTGREQAEDIRERVT